MKYYINGLLICSMMLFSVAWANRGSDAGNGGGAYVCRDENGWAKWAELEDFAEWSVFKRFEYSDNHIPTHDEIVSKIASFDPFLAIYVDNNHDQVRDDFNAGFRKIVFEPAASSNGEIQQFRSRRTMHPDYPAYCYEKYAMPFNTVAKYINDQLIIDKGTYYAMPKVDREGLFYHELIFKGLRDLYGHFKSDMTRKIVASIFTLTKNNLLIDESDQYVATTFNPVDFIKQLAKFELNANHITDLDHTYSEMQENGYKCHVVLYSNYYRKFQGYFPPKTLLSKRNSKLRLDFKLEESSNFQYTVKEEGYRYKDFIIFNSYDVPGSNFAQGTAICRINHK